MKYLDASFSVAVGSKAYRDNFDRIFSKKDQGICDALRLIIETHGLDESSNDIDRAYSMGLLRWIGDDVSGIYALTAAGEEYLTE